MPAGVELGLADVDVQGMSLLPDDLSAGDWVRLEYHGATIGLERWSGRHGPGTCIVSRGGAFEFHHTEPATIYGVPVHLYRWVPNPT